MMSNVISLGFFFVFETLSQKVAIASEPGIRLVSLVANNTVVGTVSST